MRGNLIFIRGPDAHQQIQYVCRASQGLTGSHWYLKKQEAEVEYTYTYYVLLCFIRQATIEVEIKCVKNRYVDLEEYSVK